jgi:hypothetical protein
MHDLASRGAPLGYWFWKVAWPGGGAIVDYIVRRERSEAELRVGTWDACVAGPVIHHATRTWNADADGITIDDANLSATGSHGSVEGVRWSIQWDLGGDRVLPRPDWFGPLHPFDMEVVVRPGATFQGIMIIGDREIVLDGPGAVTHYWGRRLPDSWTWISASGFDDDPDARLEAFLGSSRMWGRAPGPPAGYAWLRSGAGVDQTVMPLTGVIRVRRDGFDAHLSSLRADGRRHAIVCAAPAATFNDIGEGIRQSVLGDLWLDGRKRATGSVGLEFRSSAEAIASS